MVSDGLADTANSATITITGVNDAPEVVADFYDVPAGGASFLGNVLGNDSDPDGDDLSAFLVTGPQDGVLVLNQNGSFSYQAAGGFSGTDSFTYLASDGNGGQAQAEVTLNVAGDEFEFNEVVATPNQPFLRGGDGADALIFNTSRSTQAFGGAGADVFVFLQAGDGKRDTAYIRDFEQGVDLIDVGDAAFTLRVVGGDTTLRFSASDRDVLHVSNVTLTAADFTTEWSSRDDGLML